MWVRGRAWAGASLSAPEAPGECRPGTPSPALPVPRGAERPMGTAACGGRGFKG